MTRKNAGFTLIELLVSITIGAIVLTSAFAVYARFVQTKTQIDISRQMQKEVNFALARITDRVRNCTIKSESDTNSKKIELSCSNEKNPIFKIEKLTNDKSTLTMDGHPLLSKKFEVIIGDDPAFNITNEVGSQPKVQIHLTVQSNQDSKVSQSIRTTISSRIYQ